MKPARYHRCDSEEMEERRIVMTVGRISKIRNVSS